MNPIYTAAFLQISQKEKEELLSIFPNKLKREYFHHLTLKYKPSEEDIASTDFGKKIEIHLTGVAQDEHAQVFRCSLEKGIPCANPIPHITVATDGITPPKYSNQLLNFKTLPIADSIVVSARIGWWNGKSPVYSRPL